MKVRGGGRESRRERGRRELKQGMRGNWQGEEATR